MDTNSSFLRFGDRVVFASDVAKGCLSASGINHPNFYVPQSGKEKLALVPNQRHMVFQVLPKLNYNIARDHEKLMNKLMGSGSEAFSNDKVVVEQLKKQLEVQESRKGNERANNEIMIANQRGELVLYGMSVQLQHESSGQWLQLSKSSAETDKTCQRLELTGAPVASRVCFQITPRYKYRQDGDCIVFRDQILLYNQKLHAYVHFSVFNKDGSKEPPGPEAYAKIQENAH